VVDENVQNFKEILEVSKVHIKPEEKEAVAAAGDAE